MKMLPTRHEWRSIPLRYVCQLNPAVTFEEFEADDELTFLPMDRVKNGHFIPNVDKFSKYAPSYNAFEDGDIILAKVTPCFENGNIAIAENLTGGKGFGSSELFVIRPTKADRKFLFYYFQSSAFKQEGQASMTGAGGLKRVSPDILRQHPIPLPNEDTQRAIAAYLDRETARIDALVAAKERWLELLAEKRRALISHAVTHGLNPNAPMRDSGVPWLGEVPAHWEVMKFSWAIQIANGQVNPQDKPYADMLLIGPEHIESGTGRILNLMTSEEQAAISGKYYCENGDVIYSKIRPELRKVAIAPSDCLCSADMYPIRWRDKRDNAYIFWLLLSDQFSVWATLESARVAMPKINRDSLNELRIPTPSPFEQTTIAAYLDRVTTKIDRLQAATKNTISLLKEHRAALISAAVMGQIDIGEAA